MRKANTERRLSRPTSCPCCGSPLVRLAYQRELYGKNISPWPLVWLCDNCRASVACHPGSAVPMGVMADRETKAARNKAHAEFDRLWKHGGMTRLDAYRWLAWALGIPQSKCHISLFGKEQCEATYRLSRKARKLRAPYMVLESDK